MLACLLGYIIVNNKYGRSKLNSMEPCVFCHTTVNVGYCGLCKKYMCDTCSKKYWMRFNAFVDNARAKLHLGGRKY